MFIELSGFLLPIISIVPGLLAVFYVIKNYREFKSYVYDKPLEKLSVLVTKGNSWKTDLAHFVALSLIVVLLADIVFTAAGSLNILGFIPGVSEYASTIPEGNAPTIGNIQILFSYAPGPALGILIAFIMRQLRYRVEFKLRCKKETRKNKMKQMMKKSQMI